MSKKDLKRSTVKQLWTLVRHMEENRELAKGYLHLGVRKYSAEEEWKHISKKLNALGPPTRTLSDWKKTWADLKSRTKRKLTENKKSKRETNKHYRHNFLSELEQIIEMICFSSAESIGDFKDIAEKKSSQLNRASTRKKKPCKTAKIENVAEEDNQQLLYSPYQQMTFGLTGNSENEQDICSFTNSRKSDLDDQLAVVRHQLKMVERNAAIDNVDNAKSLADAAEVQAKAAKRNADATELLAVSMKAMADSTKRIEKLLENYFLSTNN